MIAVGVDALQVSPPFHTNTHAHTHSREERGGKHTLSPALRSASKPDIVAFTQKEKRWRKREESEGKKRGGRRGRERGREEKNFTFNPEDAHVWLSSIIPSREDRWRAFQGASPLCYTAKKRRWKEKKCH